MEWVITLTHQLYYFKKQSLGTITEKECTLRHQTAYNSQKQENWGNSWNGAGYKSAPSTTLVMPQDLIVTASDGQVEVWALVGSGAPHSNRRLDLKFCIDTSRKVSLERWKNLKLLASVFSMNYDKGLSAEKSEKTVLEIWEKKRCEITLLEGGVPVLCCYIINHPETVTYRNNNHLFCLWIQCTRLGRSHSGSFTGWQSDGERCWVILNCSCASLVLGWEANSWGSSETYVSYIHIYMYVYIHVYIYIRTHIYN